MMEDMGMGRPKVILGTDASAAQGMLRRQGIGRCRHLDVQLLWLQQKLTETQEMALVRLATSQNTADLGTKDLGSEVMRKHLAALDLEEMAGDHPDRLRATGDVGRALAWDVEAHLEEMARGSSARTVGQESNKRVGGRTVAGKALHAKTKTMM